MTVKLGRLAGATVLLATTHAQAAPSEQAARMTETARSLARTGHCDAIAELGASVRALDADYFEHVFTVDPEIATCHAAYPPGQTPPGLRDPWTALWLSGGATVGGSALLVGSLLLATGDSGRAWAWGLVPPSLIAFAVGPTLGHTYAGETWNGWLGARLVGVGMFALGTAIGFGIGGVTADRPGTGFLFAVAGLYGGGAIYAIGTLGEIGTAPGAARHYNRAHGSMDPRLTFAPIPTRTGFAPGIGLTARF